MREHVGVRALDVGDQEAPSLAREIVGRVDAHVRSPDHRRTRVEQPRDHAGRLRIVQQHDVRGANALRQQLGVRGACALVGGALGLAQPAAVALVSVQPVVQALGDAEELTVARRSPPSARRPTAARVADQRAQHLGDAAAVGGRVDVPQRPRLEQLAPAGERVFEGRERVGREHTAQALGVQRSDRRPPQAPWCKRSPLLSASADRPPRQLGGARSQIDRGCCVQPPRTDGAHSGRSATRFHSEPLGRPRSPR